MLPRFVDCGAWREDNGKGVLEVALFPKLFLTAENTTMRATLSEVVKRDGPPGACGSGEPLFHGIVTFGVTDGIRTRDNLGHNQAL